MKDTRILLAVHIVRKKGRRQAEWERHKKVHKKKVISRNSQKERQREKQIEKERKSE